jgi:RNA polymerase sigma factor (sigma-70 family)
LNPAPLIRVVDDDESMRTALLRILTASGYAAQGFASTGEFLLHAPRDQPGCVLLDLRLPGPSGLDLQAALPGHGFTLPVIFMTGYPEVAASVRAMKAGAVDFLEKPIERKTLFEALERALARDECQRRARAEADGLRERFATLTPREREVLERVVAGKLNKQIADELGIGERTVKAQRAQLMEKLAAGSAAELGALVERLRNLSAT